MALEISLLSRAQPFAAWTRWFVIVQILMDSTLVIKEYENTVKWGGKDIDRQAHNMTNGGNMQQFWELLCFCLVQNSE